MNEECNKVCREPMTKERLYKKINADIRQSEISIIKGETRYDTLMDVKRALDLYFEDLNAKENDAE
jgi:hypothetical protein